MKVMTQYGEVNGIYLVQAPRGIHLAVCQTDRSWEVYELITGERWFSRSTRQEVVRVAVKYANENTSQIIQELAGIPPRNPLDDEHLVSYQIEGWQQLKIWQIEDAIDQVEVQK